MHVTPSKHLISVVGCFFTCHSNWRNSRGYGDSLQSIINSLKLHCFEFKHLYPCFVLLWECSWIKSFCPKSRGQEHKWLERWIRKNKNERKGGNDESYSTFTEAVFSGDGWPTRILQTVLGLFWAIWPTPIDTSSNFHWWSYLLFTPYSVHLFDKYVMREHHVPCITLRTWAWTRQTTPLKVFIF